MDEEQVKMLGEALQLLGKVRTIIKKVQIEIASELVRQEVKEQKGKA